MKRESRGGEGGAKGGREEREGGGWGVVVERVGGKEAFVGGGGRIESVGGHLSRRDPQGWALYLITSSYFSEESAVCSS